MQTAVLALDLEEGRGGTMLQIAKHAIAFVAVIGAHTIDVALEIAVLDKFCQCELLKIRYCAGIKAQLLIKK